MMGNSANFVTVCGYILQEFFGDKVQRVAIHLLKEGPQTIQAVVSGSHLPLQEVKDALNVLLQHNLGQFSSKTGYTHAEYTIIPENIVFLLRLPRALNVIEECLGVEARGLIEEIVCRGQLPLSKLLFICGLKHFHEDPKISPAEIVTILEKYYRTFEGLAVNHYTCRSSDLVEDSTVHVPKFVSNEKFKYALPSGITFEEIALKIIANNGNLSAMDDAVTPWKIDIDNFNREWRDSIVLNALTKRYRNMVDPKIFRILTSNSFSTCMDGLPIETPTISYREIVEQLKTKYPDSTKTISTLNEQLDTILADPKTFVECLESPGGGHYSINYVSAMTHLMYETVEKIIQQRHGFYAARIFRLIKENKFVEQDRVQELGMIPSKESKHLTFLLMQENFVKMKEVRKNYKATATSNKICYLFYIDIYQVINTILESCYEAVANSYQRSALVKYNNRVLIAKEERIARILATVRTKGPPYAGEEQLREIEEMITPPEREVLHKVNQQKAKLVSGMFNVDETIFILQEYLNCQEKKARETKTKK